jgi:hypothetical protein
MQISGQVYQLTMLLNQVQQDLQQHKLALLNLNTQGLPVGEPVMVHGVHDVEDAVEQLQLELQCVESRLRSDDASIGGHVFESCEETFKCFLANCSPEDWQCVMGMPALYSLARPDGQGYRVLLGEKSNSSKVGYASCTQARLALSFKTKLPEIFGAENSAKNGHPFDDIDDCSKWESNGLKKGFWHQIEDAVKALESSLYRKASAHLLHNTVIMFNIFSE